MQTPQDFAFSSLTGTPTTVSTFTNDANYLDSNTVTGVIDATYVQSNQTAQDFSYASLTGKPNILDSANISSIIIADVDQAFVNGLNIDADNLDGQSGSYYLNYTNLTNTPNVLDSADVTAIHNALGGVDSAAITNLIDSAYIAARTSAGTDSATVVSIVNEYIDQTATSLTTTVVDQVVDTFAAVTYRTAKYIVQFSHPSDSKYHSTEVLLMHDGTTVYMTEYAEVKTDSSLGTIDADINAGNVRLLVTPSYTNTGVNVTRTNVTV